MKLGRILITILCLSAFSPQTAASYTESSLSFRRFTTIDGLPQMQIETIWQDSEGYIWIGTLSGFVRYDGKELIPFLGGRRENIVMFREYAGKPLAMGFVRQWSIHGKSLKMSQIDDEGKLLLNNLNAADLPSDCILLEDRQEQNRVLCRLGPDGPIPFMEAPEIDEMTPDRKLCIDSSKVYIPTPHGLYVSEGEGVSRLSCKPDVFSIKRTSGGLLALAADGIYGIGKDSLTLVYRHRFEAPDYGLSVQENQQGRLIIADAHTIWSYDPASDIPFKQLASGFNLIRGLFIDKWNRLWAATYQGAYCFFHCNFENHRLTDKNDIVRSVCACGGHLVAGTLNGKVLFDGKLIDEREGNFYSPGAATVGGAVYMAGNGDVACIRDGATSWLNLPGDRYRFVAPAGEKLIVGGSRSVLSYDPESGRLDTLATGIARPWCAAEGTQRRLWLGCNPGLYCISGTADGESTVCKVLSTPTTPVVTAMAADSQGTVCFALGDELYIIRNAEPQLMKELKPVLTGHEIRAVHITAAGHLVIAAIDGLLIARLGDDGRASDLQWFDSNSGFTSIEPLMGSMAESEDGTVWLPGLEEMVSFRPADLLADNREPAVVKSPHQWWQRWWVLMLAAVLLSLTVWRFAHRAGQRQARRKMALLEREKKQKELQLQAIRLKAIPHFHSNVLSGIEYFILNKSTDEAAHYLKLYSDFTNQTLSDIDKPSRTVFAEVEYVRNYLELEKLRYGERLNYHINVAQDVDLKTPLPTMLLHTYCQNAVKHGIASKAGTGCVDVTVEKQCRNGADGVLVSVRDDGVGRVEAARSSGYSTGQGLKILRQQIELYNQANKLHIEQKVTDLTDTEGRPAGTCFETWVPADYNF